MRRTIRLLPIGLVFAASVASAAAGTTKLGRRDLTAAGFRPVQVGHAERQIALSRSAAWQSFNSRYGRWNAIWNEQTGTPHRAFGESITLRGFSPNPASATSSVKNFIASNPDVFGGAHTLQPVFAERHGSVWYVRYRQSLSGVPVLFSDWEFRVSDGGKLMAFGADARPEVASVPTQPRIDAARAREAAKAGLAFNPTTDWVSGGDARYLLPIEAAGGTDYRLVYDMRVFTRKPHGNWITLVDAENGNVLWRHNRVQYGTISGTVKGRIHPHYPTDTLVTTPLPDMYVDIDATTVGTDAFGFYTSPCSGTSSTVSAAMAGRYAHTVRFDDLPDASFSTPQACSGTRNILWDQSNSDYSERDAYYHLAIAHGWIKAIDPAYVGSDYDLTLTVNSLDDECAAYWDGFGVTFGVAGTSCPATATIPDLVYHEFAHQVSDDFYFSRGAPLGAMINDALQEGIAHATSAFMQDESYLGDGLNGPGTYGYDLSLLRRWPEDQSADPSETGLILGGALWDLRSAIGVVNAAHLMHFARYGLPDDDDDQVAMNEYFVEVLIADDDDANLANGTPHMNEIVASFSAHNIGTNGFIQIGHTVMEDQPTGGPYPVTATIQYVGPFGALDPSSPRLFYSVNSVPYVSTAMTPTGNPDEWGADVPGQSAGIVKYYIQAGDVNGGVQTLPGGAPNRSYLFIAGPASTLQSYDMETTAGWVSGAAGDNATVGQWVRVVPIETIAQTGANHTPGGTMCWVTGNGTDENPGAFDVDDGVTTLLSPIFDATPVGLTYPIVSYYRWYSNNAGDNPGINTWQVDISNNGGTSWVPVESTMLTDQSWRRVIFFIKDFITPTSNMRMRFRASDIGDGALVESAVDDWDLIAFVGPVSVPEAAPVAHLSLAAPAPNPFGSFTRLSYSLPAAGSVDLVVFDINGRRVRALASGIQPAGPHSAEWDGRDQSGRPVASGPYFVRLNQNGVTSTQAVVRIR